jgi:DNA polymerase-3 subunit epsilon
LKFAVVDIETTGLFHQGHGITEVSVVGLDEGKYTVLFHKLFNPGRDIPAGVEAITGINANLTANKAHVSDSLEELEDLLNGRIFVAHNVNFDYQFLKAVFQQNNRSFSHKRLCTLRYARKVIPQLKSHKLSALCEYLEIENIAQHRANGDALATAKLLTALMDRDADRLILNRLLGRSEHHMVLPSQLNEEDVLNLPEKPGVYYLFDGGTKPIYIGKAKSLKKRVLSHFTSAGSSRRKQLFQRLIQRIEYKETQSEYHALLLEDAEIKRYWPRYNRAQKERRKAFAVVPYVDRLGNRKFAIVNKPHTDLDVLGWFNSLHAAKNWIYQSFLEYGIDPRRAGLPVMEEFSDLDDSDTDEAVDAFMHQCFSEQRQSYVLLELQSRRFALITKGRYRGFGRLEEGEAEDFSQFETAMRPAPDSPSARAVIRSMLADQNIQKIDFS